MTFPYLIIVDEIIGLCCIRDRIRAPLPLHSQQRTLAASPVPPPPVWTSDPRVSEDTDSMDIRPTGK